MTAETKKTYVWTGVAAGFLGFDRRSIARADRIPVSATAGNIPT